MKILNLTQKSKTYTSCVYLLLGTYNAIDDVNALIDVGRDPMIIERLDNAPTGIGKKRVEKVVLTHSHFDHVSLLPVINEKYNPVVYAFSKTCGADKLLADRDRIQLADRTFEVIHINSHSSDSVWLYCEEDGVLFSGDTPVIFNSYDIGCSEDFVRKLADLAGRKVKYVYPGHGPRIDTQNGRLLVDSVCRLRKVLRNAKRNV